MPNWRTVPTLFNPRPPWGGRLVIPQAFDDAADISIHALRGEGDPRPLLLFGLCVGISIHALRGEGDVDFRHFVIVKIISIHALRGEGDDFGR